MLEAVVLEDVGMYIMAEQWTDQDLTEYVLGDMERVTRDRFLFEMAGDRELQMRVAGVYGKVRTEAKRIRQETQATTVAACLQEPIKL